MDPTISRNENTRDETTVYKDLRDARAKLRAALENLRDEAMRVVRRAEGAIDDVRNSRITYHAAARLEGVQTASEKVAPLEDRIQDLSRELAAVRA